MTHDTLYTIGELAEAAEVTPRTIRYYTAEGLLPPPDTRGRYALYGGAHLLRLRLIARLKEAYLPLGEIKARMEHLSAEQVAQLLAEYNQPLASKGSAADYIAHVLTVSAASPAVQEDRRHMAEPNVSAARVLAESPSIYTAVPEQGVPAGRPGGGNLPIGFAAPAPPAPALAPGPLKRIASQRSEAAPAAQAAAEETWRRLTLALGVELHIREPVPPDMRERIAGLLELARDLFGA
jgi:DNA-binding transcriptional MerR regulator